MPARVLLSTLEKKAASATAAEAKAERVAMKVGVVQAVKNRRPVVPTAIREIRSARRRGHQGSSVNNGVVREGKTTSLEAHVESGRVAYAVRGGRQGSTELEVRFADPVVE